MRHPNLVIAAAGALALAGATTAQTGDTAAPVALSVQTVQTAQENWDDTVRANGGLYAWQESVVAAETGGLAIVELAVDVGDQVKRGQLLARLNDEAVAASVARLRAELERATATLREAHMNADRARGVRRSGAMSDQLIAQYLTAEQTAQAGVAAAEAALKVEQVRLKQTHITAVDDGVISARSATLGAVVPTGGELFRLVRQGRIEWRAELTAAQLARVQPGQPARLTLSDGREVEGSVRMVSPTLDPVSRKAIAYVALPVGGPARAGMFAQGDIHLSRRPATTLPQSALLLRDGYCYVFSVAADGHLVEHKVAPGRQRDGRVEVLGGLPQGARVVASGAAFLHPGDAVRVVDAPAAGGAR